MSCIVFDNSKEIKSHLLHFLDKKTVENKFKEKNNNWFFFEGKRFKIDVDNKIDKFLSVISFKEVFNDDYLDLDDNDISSEFHLNNFKFNLSKIEKEMIIEDGCDNDSFDPNANFKNDDEISNEFIHILSNLHISHHDETLVEHSRQWNNRDWPFHFVLFPNNSRNKKIARISVNYSPSRFGTLIFQLNDSEFLSQKEKSVCNVIIDIFNHFKFSQF